MEIGQRLLRYLKNPSCVISCLIIILITVTGCIICERDHGYEPISKNTFYRLPACQKGIVHAIVNRSGQRANYNVVDAANRICTALATDRALLKSQQESDGPAYLIHAYETAIREATPARIASRMRLSYYYHGDHKYASLAERPRQRFDHVFAMYLPSHIQHQYQEHIRYMKINETVAAEQ